MLKKQNKKLIIDSDFSKKLKIAIVRTDYHKDLNETMEKYCIKTLSNNGVLKSNIKSFCVPGAWEIPIMAQKLAKSQKFDAIVTFGVIIKGDTYHFEMLAQEVGRALMQISLVYNLPIIMEILAVYKKEDAIKRAGNNEYNKGIEAGTTTLKILKTLKYE